MQTAVGFYVYFYAQALLNGEMNYPPTPPCPPTLRGTGILKALRIGGLGATKVIASQGFIPLFSNATFMPIAVRVLATSNEGNNDHAKTWDGDNEVVLESATRLEKHIF